MSGGTAALGFTGEGVAQTLDGRDLLVTGNSLVLASLAAAGTSQESVITVSGTGGDGRVDIAAITSDGPLKRLNGDPVALTGTLTSGGPVKRLRLLRTENATLQLAGGRGKSSVTIHDAAMDTDITSAAPIARLEFASFGGVDGGDVITAPAIDRIVAGIFQGDIAVDSAGKLDLEVIKSTHLTASGSVARVRGQTAEGFRADIGGSIGEVRFVYLSRSYIYAGIRALPDGSPVPATIADFVAPSRIGGVWIGAADSTFETVIAGRNVRRVFLGRVVTDRGDFHAYVVADRVDRLNGTTFLASKYQRRFSAKALDNETRDLGSFEVRAL